MATTGLCFYIHQLERERGGGNSKSWLLVEQEDVAIKVVRQKPENFFVTQIKKATLSHGKELLACDFYGK